MFLDPRGKLYYFEGSCVCSGMNKNSTTFTCGKTELIHSIFQILDRTLSLLNGAIGPQCFLLKMLVW